jgi:hypothetical protein
MPNDFPSLLEKQNNFMHFGSGALVAALFTLVSVETNGQPARPDGTQGSRRIGRDREVPWTCAQAEV